jgi:hypothetical protein
MNAADFIRMPIVELVNPEKRGPLNVYQNYWWVIDENDNAMFFKSHISPQCNLNKLVVERVLCAGLKARIIQLTGLGRRL